MAETGIIIDMTSDIEMDSEEFLAPKPAARQPDSPEVMPTRRSRVFAIPDPYDDEDPDDDEDICKDRSSARTYVSRTTRAGTGNRETEIFDPISQVSVPAAASRAQVALYAIQRPHQASQEPAQAVHSAAQVFFSCTPIGRVTSVIRLLQLACAALCPTLTPFCLPLPFFIVSATSAVPSQLSRQDAPNSRPSSSNTSLPPPRPRAATSPRWWPAAPTRVTPRPCAATPSKRCSRP